MSIRINNFGKNNVVDVPEDIIESFSGQITFHGDDDYFVVKTPARRIGEIDILLAHGSRVYIDHSISFIRLYMYAEGGSVIDLKEGVSFNGPVEFDTREGRRIDIGRGCLFAANVSMMTCDMHSILDLETGERLNKSKDIKIGQNVWIGGSADILKGADIGNNTIISRRAVVTKAIPANCVAAGCPARVIRTGVTWDWPLL